MIQKNKILIASAVIIVAVSGTATIVQLESNNTVKTSTQQQSATKPSPIHYLSYKGVQGKTALALLQARAEVVVKNSSYGPYVDSVNGVKGGTDSKYWTFYINGKQATVGAGAYTTNNGDKIEWKFQ